MSEKMPIISDINYLEVYMPSITDKLMSRVQRKKRGWVFCPKDFLDLGARAAVDKALSRLVKAGKFRRIARGLYDRPVKNKLLGGVASPSAISTAKAISRRDGIRLLPDDAVAANKLRLTTQVPARLTYYTDGPNRTVRIAGKDIYFRHARRKQLQWADRGASDTVQALYWLGKAVVSQQQSDISNHLISILPDHIKRDLMNRISLVPGWMVPTIQQINQSRFS